MAVPKLQADESAPRFPQYPGDFYRRYTIEELARMQGVRPVENFDSLLGGWPADEIEDGFEKALEVWRGHDLRDREELESGRR
jgi:hypothetical protein